MVWSGSSGTEGTCQGDTTDAPTQQRGTPSHADKVPSLGHLLLFLPLHRILFIAFALVRISSCSLTLHHFSIVIGRDHRHRYY